MEFRLNKIDTDLRKKMKGKTKNGKVHKFTEVNIEPDVKRALKHKVDCEKLADSEKKYVTINSVKASGEFEVDAEFKCEDGQANSGLFLDTRK